LLSTHPTFKKIPDGATLIGFGHCFYKEGYWQIATFFRTSSSTVAQINLAIEALPALALGRTYSTNRISLTPRPLHRFKLPELVLWQCCSMKDIPQALYKPYYKYECQDQQVYKIIIGDQVLWLPVIELARIIFLKTAENCRQAFYEPNLLTMADIEHHSRSKVTINLSAHYPKELIEVKAHQRFLAWLLLNPDISSSFNSVYQLKRNKNPWTFTFNPFEMTGVILSCYVSDHANGYFVYEISAVARLPSTAQYDEIIIQHPDDVIYKRPPNEDEPPPPPSGNSRYDPQQPNTTVDDTKPTSPRTKHRILNIPKGQLHFNVLLEPERNPEVLEKDKPKGQPREESQKPPPTVGLTNTDTEDGTKKADFQSLRDPNPESKDFFDHIRQALKYIQDEKGWDILERTGKLTHETAKSFLSLGQGTRRYFHAEIQQFGETIANILEIDVSDQHGLSTMVCMGPTGERVIDQILAEMIKKTGRWDKKLNNKLMDFCAYIAHPKGLLSQSQEELKIVYENWGTRLLAEI